MGALGIRCCGQFGGPLQGKNRRGCPLPGWLDPEAVFHAGLAVSYLFMATGAHLGARTAAAATAEPGIADPSTPLLHHVGRASSATLHTAGPMHTAGRGPRPSLHVNRMEHT